MASDHEQSGAGQNRSANDALDRELDAALTMYASVEPRAGLEERVLAQLQSELEHAPRRAWWSWPARVVAAAALVVAVIALMVRPEMRRPNRSAPEITAQPPTTLPGDRQTGAHSATSNMGGQAHPTALAGAKRSPRHGARHGQEFVAGGPRLDHFPSLRPLTEEEELLVRYVQDFPQEAVMIAKAQQESEMELEKLNGSENQGASRGQQQVQQQDQQ